MKTISNFDLHLIVSVAQTGSFRRSGAHLDIGQSAVSRRIARLEDELGVSLFERSTTGAKLTRAGQRFFQRARYLLRDFQIAVDSARSAGAAESGQLNVGLTISLSKGSFRKIVSRYREDQPDVAIRFTATERDELLSLLTNRILDVVAFAGYGRCEGSDTLKFENSALFLAVPASGKFAALERLSWKDVETAEFILSSREPGPEIYHHVVRMVSGFGRPARVAWHELGREGVMNLVGLGLGVTLVVDQWCGVTYTNVAYVPIGDEGEAVPFSLAWLPENDNPALRRFISLARVEAKRNGAAS